MSKCSLFFAEVSSVSDFEHALTDVDLLVSVFVAISLVLDELIPSPLQVTKLFSEGVNWVDLA